MFWVGLDSGTDTSGSASAGNCLAQVRRIVDHCAIAREARREEHVVLRYARRRRAPTDAEPKWADPERAGVSRDARVQLLLCRRPQGRAQNNSGTGLAQLSEVGKVANRRRSLTLIDNASITTSFEMIVWGHFYLRITVANRRRLDSKAHHPVYYPVRYVSADPRVRVRRFQRFKRPWARCASPEPQALSCGRGWPGERLVVRAHVGARDGPGGCHFARRQRHRRRS